MLGEEEFSRGTEERGRWEGGCLLDLLVDHKSVWQALT